MLSVIGLDNMPLVREGDDMVELIHRAIQEKKITLDEGDIVAVTEKIVAKSEGNLVNLKDIVPSQRAVKLAKETGKNPRIVELILRESKEILCTGANFILVETKHGFVCANAGIDLSNVEPGKAKLLPSNPERSADRIRRGLERRCGKGIGVIIVDSFGRPFRHGTVGTAIGASGVKTLWDRRGERDIYDRELKITRVGVGDCLASAAALLLGDGAEQTPVVVIKGLKFGGNGTAQELVREKKGDIFRR